jgi:hypothetical protein
MTVSVAIPLRRLADRGLGVLPARLRTAGALAGLFLALGLALRAYNYLRNPSLWHDEAALVLNAIGKGFGELLGPLFYAEAAPPLFLWVERAAVLLLGDGTYALRLLPFLAGCAALLLFLPVARAWLRPAAVPWAVLLFAFNDHLLWHASEAKPYSFDVLVATALLALWCRTRGWPLERRLVLYALLAPAAIFLVYPGCFLLGGLLLALLPGLWHARARPGAWLSYGALALSVGTSFLLLYLGPARAQRNAGMEGCWLEAFPPWGGPWWAVPVWVVKSTLDALCYCCAPAGNVLAPVLIVGGVGLWRGGRRTDLLLLLAPAGLALAAAFVGGYPYAGARVLVYLTPAVVLLIAAGLPPALGWLAARSRPAAAALVLVVLAALGTVGKNTAFPTGRADTAGASRYVLAGLRPGDLIKGTSWEDSYYYRHQREEFIPEGCPMKLPGGRLWLVVTAATARDREETVHGLAPAGWECAGRREFYRTTVVLLRRPPGHAGTTDRGPPE